MAEPQAFVKTCNFPALVNLSVTVPVFGAKLDLYPLPFKCCKKLVQSGIYLKRETHNHVHSQGLPG